MIRKIVGVSCLPMVAIGFFTAGTGQGESVVASIVISVVFLVAGLVLLFGKGKSKEKKAAKKAQRQEAKEQHLRTLSCKHIAGLTLDHNCVCAVRFDEDEVVISGGESIIRVPFEKCVNLKVEQETNIERYYGYSIPGALIGGAVLGPAGAGMMGVRQKKRRTYANYLVIAYNPEKNRVNNLVFLLVGETIFKVNWLVKTYLPRCGGQRVDITL